MCAVAPEPESDVNDGGISTASLLKQMDDAPFAGTTDATNSSGSSRVSSLRSSFETGSTPAATPASGGAEARDGMDTEARRRTKFKMAFTQLRDDVSATVDVEDLEVEENLDSPTSLGSASTVSPGIRSLISPAGGGRLGAGTSDRTLADVPDVMDVSLKLRIACYCVPVMATTLEMAQSAFASVFVSCVRRMWTSWRSFSKSRWASNRAQVNGQTSSLSPSLASLATNEDKWLIDVANKLLYLA